MRCLGRLLLSILLATCANMAFGEATVFPTAGSMLLRSDKGAEMLFITETAVRGDGVPDHQRCGQLEWRTLPVKSDGWLTLDLSVSPAQEKEFADWLEQASPAQQEMSNAALIRRFVSATEAALDVFSADLPHPRQIRHHVRITPKDCLYIEADRHSVQRARDVVDFPIAFHYPAMRDSVGAPFLLTFLFELVVHETVHVLQLFPYDDIRLDWLTRSRPAKLPGHVIPISIEAEIRALMIDRCIRQAAVPGDWNHERPAQTWRDRRELYRALMKDELPAFRAVREEFFARQARILGSRFVNAHKDAELEKLFPHCAMYFRRPGVVKQGDRPSKEEILIGHKALSAIRRVTAPILFKSLVYDDLPLP